MYRLTKFSVRKTNVIYLLKIIEAFFDVELLRDIIVYAELFS